MLSLRLPASPCVSLRLPASPCVSLLIGLFSFLFAGSGTSWAQTATITGGKYSVPPPPYAPPNTPPTVYYYVTPQIQVTIPANSESIAGTYQVSKKVNGQWQPFGGQGTFGTNFTAAAQPYSYSVQISVQKPPAAGDEYKVNFAYRIKPVGQNPPAQATEAISQPYTLMP